MQNALTVCKDTLMPKLLKIHAFLDTLKHEKLFQMEVNVETLLHTFSPTEGGCAKIETSMPYECT